MEKGKKGGGGGGGERNWERRRIRGGEREGDRDRERGGEGERVIIFTPLSVARMYKVKSVRLYKTTQCV